MDKKKKSEITRKSIAKTQSRITITIKKEEGEQIKEKIKKSGKSMNQFIIDAIRNEIKNNHL